MNQDYFGEDEKQGFMGDTSIDRITQIKKHGPYSEYSGIMTKHNDGNDTIDELAFDLENPKGGIYRVGKQKKIANSENEEDLELNSPKKEDEYPDFDTLDSQSMRT